MKEFKKTVIVTIGTSYHRDMPDISEGIFTNNYKIKQANPLRTTT